MEDQPLSEFDTITVGGGAMTAAAPDFDPMLLSVLGLPGGPAASAPSCAR